MSSDVYFQLPDGVLKKLEVKLLFPLFVHRDYESCTKLAEETEDDLNQIMNVRLDTKVISPCAYLGRVHFMPLTVPESIPERLGLMTIIMHGGMVFDDYYDMVKEDEGQSFSNQIIDVLSNESSQHECSLTSVSELALKQWRAKSFLKMLQMDRENALRVMKTWQEESDAAALPTIDALTLDEYIPKRLPNAGMGVWEDGVYFARGVHLTEAERKRLLDVNYPTRVAAIMVNDFLSWPKEAKSAIEQKDGLLPVNAVGVVMKEKNCSETEARDIVKDQFEQCQRDHISQVELLRAELGEIPSSFQKIITSMQSMVSGAAYWTTISPRYPTKAMLNQPECVIADGKLAYKDDFELVLNGDVEKKDSPEIPLPALKEIERAGKEEGVANIQEQSNNILIAPFNYLSSLPSRKVRETFIDALDWWISIDTPSKATIKELVKMLHHASLMLDDIQDDSSLRRGRPATHMLYGSAQTINAATHTFTRAFEEASKLPGTTSIRIFLVWLTKSTDEVKNLHGGQALELYWRYHTTCPSSTEYMTMADNKTGGLFRLCVRLMQAQAPSNSANAGAAEKLERFVTHLGRFFQIRDDYCNLTSEEYANQKGFAEDLDEGKFSLPLIYTLNAPGSPRDEILGLLHRQNTDTGLPLEMKSYILDEMKRVGALQATRVTLEKLQDTLYDELRVLEEHFGKENYEMKVLLESLRI